MGAMDELTTPPPDRRYSTNPVWKEGADADELDYVERLDARLVEIRSEHDSLCKARKTVTNRCAQRALARRRRN